MPHKYGVYVIDIPIDVIWQKNLEFWQSQHGNVEESKISPNRLFRKFKFKHKMNFHVYAYSIGETYEFKFGYSPEDRLCFILVDIKFSMFGRGFVWKIPQEIINKWAKALNIPSLSLYNKPTPEYFQIKQKLKVFDDIQKITSSERFCPQCGSEAKPHHKFCVNCGLDFEKPPQKSEIF